MIDEFQNLSEDETETMYKVPVLVSILIAGADNEIDRSEIRKAVDLSSIKQRSAREELIAYYREVGQDFEDKMKVLILQYPSEADKRNKEIIEELEELNKILPKLDRKFAIEFYASVKDIAKKVAEASGGVLGYMNIGYEESRLIDLKMIKDPATY
ncbi:MAG: hypothetical protein ACNS60_18995 [Candidatus Cyclobacteriaceae bacterium M2_1C_046]